MIQPASCEFANHPRSLQIDYAVRDPALQQLAQEEMQDLLHATAVARINNYEKEKEIASVAKEPKVLLTNVIDATQVVELEATTNNPALQPLLDKELSDLYAQEHVQQPHRDRVQGKDVQMNNIAPFLVRLQQERSVSQDKGFSIV